MFVSLNFLPQQKPTNNSYLRVRKAPEQKSRIHTTRHTNNRLKTVMLLTSTHIGIVYAKLQAATDDHLPHSQSRPPLIYYLRKVTRNTLTTNTYGANYEFETP